MLDITVARFCLQDSATEKIETVRSPKFYQDSREYSEIDKIFKNFFDENNETSFLRKLSVSFRKIS